MQADHSVVVLQQVRRRLRRLTTTRIHVHGAELAAHEVARVAQTIPVRRPLGERPHLVDENQSERHQVVHFRVARELSPEHFLEFERPHGLHLVLGLAAARWSEIIAQTAFLFLPTIIYNARIILTEPAR